MPGRYNDVGSRKRTLKSLILEEEGNERKGIETERVREIERERERRTGVGRGREVKFVPRRIYAPDSRTDEASCRVSRACFSFGYTLSDNATRRDGYAGKYRGYASRDYALYYTSNIIA